MIDAVLALCARWRQECEKRGGALSTFARNTVLRWKVRVGWRFSCFGGPCDGEYHRYMATPYHRGGDYCFAPKRGRHEWVQFASRRDAPNTASPFDDSGPAHLKGES